MMPVQRNQAIRLANRASRIPTGYADPPRGAGRDIISLAAGSPASEAIPIDDLSVAFGEVLAQGRTALQYGEIAGWADLREWIALREAIRRGRAVAADQVLITAGAQQGLDLLARVLLDPGDTVALEDPAFPGARAVFQLWEAQLAGITVDGNGLDTDVLRAKLGNGLRPKLLYTVASFQNPSGITLSGARRKDLADLADRFGFLVVEDDAYVDLRFVGEPVPPVASMTDNVVSLGSFSKTVAPGLRLGWMIAPRSLAPALSAIKIWADLGCPHLTQRALLRVLEKPGWLASRIDYITSLYREREQALRDGFTRHLGGRLTVNAPHGGIFSWATLTSDSLTSDELLPHAVSLGVSFVPGSLCSVEVDWSKSLRLSFATQTVDRLHEAARRLVAALEQAEQE